MKSMVGHGRWRGGGLLLLFLTASLFAESLSLDVFGKDGSTIYFTAKGKKVQIGRMYRVQQGNILAGTIVAKKQAGGILYGVVVKEGEGFKVGEKALLELQESGSQKGRENFGGKKEKPAPISGFNLIYPLSTTPYQKHYETSFFKADGDIGNDLPKFLFHLYHALAQKIMEKLALPKKARIAVLFLYTSSPSAQLIVETKESGGTKPSTLLRWLPIPLPHLSLPFINYIPLSGIFFPKDTHKILASSDTPFGPQFPSHWQMLYDALVYHLHNDKKADVVEIGTFSYPISSAQIRTVTGQNEVLSEIVGIAQQAKADVVILGSLGGSVIRLDARRRPFQKKHYLSVRLQLSLRAVDVHSGEVLTAALSSVEDRYSLGSQFVWRDLFDVLFVGSGIAVLVHNSN